MWTYRKKKDFLMLMFCCDGCQYFSLSMRDTDGVVYHKGSKAAAHDAGMLSCSAARSEELESRRAGGGRLGRGCLTVLMVVLLTCTLALIFFTGDMGARDAARRPHRRRIQRSESTSLPPSRRAESPHSIHRLRG